jgi:hypothetical protein
LPLKSSSFIARDPLSLGLTSLGRGASLVNPGAHDIIFSEHSMEDEMSLILRKTPNGLYEATASPPHTKTPWSTTKPIAVRRLIEELKARGCHQQDIGDAIYEQDQNWMEKL